MAREVGILGGTFDPIHIGHVILAVHAREQLSLSEVILVPNLQSPLKSHHPFAEFDDRFAMTTLAVQDIPAISASDIDGQRGGTSYMIDTLRALDSLQPGADFTLLLGYDALYDFPQWHQADEILKFASLAAVGRGGESLADAPVPARVIEMPRIDISSSEIRDRLARDLPINGMTPIPVVDYIQNHRLYRPTP